MPRPLATLRCTIPARKSLSEPTAKRKHKKKRNLKIKKEIKSNILIRVPNVSEIYFLPFSEIRVGWTGFSARGIKKKIKPPNYFSKSRTRVLKKRNILVTFIKKKCKETKES